MNISELFILSSSIWGRGAGFGDVGGLVSAREVWL